MKIEIVSNHGRQARCKMAFFSSSGPGSKPLYSLAVANPDEVCAAVRHYLSASHAAVEDPLCPICRLVRPKEAGK